VGVWGKNVEAVRREVARGEGGFSLGVKKKRPVNDGRRLGRGGGV